MDGRQQEQPNERYCRPASEKKLPHNDIGNSTPFRHGDILLLKVDFTMGSDARTPEE